MITVVSSPGSDVRHPVAQSALPPGPRLPAAVQGALFLLSYERFSSWLHRNFGPTVTLQIPGTSTVILSSDRELARIAFTGDPLERAHGNDALIPLVGERSVMVLDPASHLQRRRLLLPAFHGERLSGYEQLMERLVEQETASWRNGERVVVRTFAQRLTLEVILRAVFGVADREVRQRMGRVFEAMLDPMTMLVFSVFMATGARAQWLAGRFYRLREQLDQMLYEHIAASRRDPRLDERADILALLIQARDERGAGLSDEELRDELATLIAAGFETTATAIAWGVDLLTHTPKVMHHARAAAIADDDRYLNAMVKEVLRVRTTIPVAAGRHFVKSTCCGDWMISPEELVLIDGWAIHHDPSLYPEPHDFRPERFLDSEPDSYALIPFGGGTHRCLGAALAQMEIRIVLTHLLKRFELVPIGRRPERARRRSTTLSPRRGTRVRIIRERPNAATT